MQPSCEELCSSLPAFSLSGEQICQDLPPGNYSIPCDLLPADLVDTCKMFSPDGIFNFTYRDGNITFGLGDEPIIIPYTAVIGSLVISFLGAGGDFTIENAETGDVAFAVPCVDIIGIFYDCE